MEAATSLGRGILHEFMRESNRDAVQRGFEAFAQADRTGWDEVTDPEVEAIPVANWPETEVRGRDAVWGLLVAADEPWAPGPYELTEMVEVNDRVVARIRRQLRGRSSGVEVDYDYWIGITFADGRATRFEWFPTREEAVKALGMAAD